MTGTGSKRCSRCGEVKPRADFPPNRHRREGLQSYCRTCGTAMQRERRERVGTERERLQNIAYRAAIRTLVRRHRAEFDQLHEIELAAMADQIRAVELAAPGGEGTLPKPAPTGPRDPARRHLSRDDARGSDHPGAIKNSA